MTYFEKVINAVYQDGADRQSFTTPAHIYGLILKALEVELSLHKDPKDLFTKNRIDSYEESYEGQRLYFEDVYKV